MLTPVDDRKVNSLGCNVMKPPACGTRGRICPEVSLNLQEICENADTFVHQNERVTFNVTQNKQSRSFNVLSI